MILKSESNESQLRRDNKVNTVNIIVYPSLIFLRRWYWDKISNCTKPYMYKLTVLCTFIDYIIHGQYT